MNLPVIGLIGSAEKEGPRPVHCKSRFFVQGFWAVTTLYLIFIQITQVEHQVVIGSQGLSSCRVENGFGRADLQGNRERNGSSTGVGHEAAVALVGLCKRPERTRPVTT